MPSGTVYFEQCSASATLCASVEFGFYANFFFTSESAQSCLVTTSGSCSFYSCNGTTTTPTGASAGTLTISGGRIPSGLTVTPDANNAYSYTSGAPLFAAGQTLTVSATGAIVPAFGPQSVVAPALPGLVAPAATSGSYTISTAAELGVQWTGGAAGATLVLEGTSGGGNQSYFICEWDASLGKASVPQAVISGLAGHAGAYIVYGQYKTTTFTAGAYSISEVALPYSGGTATFQ
jgi:hypothetical protein